MPNIKINKKELKKLVNVTDEVLKDRIPMLGTDLDSITEDEIDVEIFPNRPDLLSEQGFGRALSSFLGMNTGLKKYEVIKGTEKVIVKKVPQRPFTSCAIVKGLNLDDDKIIELMNIQEKLATTHGRRRKKSAYGIYPLDKIKFPITYEAKNANEVEFHPLGMPKPIKAIKILEMHQKGREYKNLAKDWETFPFFIDNDNKILSMLPFTNSEDLGKVTIDTKEVFIECTGTDKENVEIALNILVTTLADMGGVIESVDVNGKELTLKPNEMSLDLKYVNKLLGLNLNEENLQELLGKMGHDYLNGIVKYPCYRADIMHPIDFVEEVAIAYGYENFIEEIPNISTIAIEDNLQKKKRLIATSLIGLGMKEVETVHLSNEKVQGKKCVMLKSSVNEDFNVLRKWMTPSIMEVLSNNRSVEYPQKIFGMGKTFFHADTDTGVKEKEKLCVAIAGDVSYTDIRQVLDYLFRELDEVFEIKEKDYNHCIPGRSAEIVEKGYLGEVHPEMLEQFGIEVPVVILEIEL